MMRPPSLPVPPNVCPYCTAGDADAVGINRNATSAAVTKMALLLRKTPPPPGSDWFEGYLWIRAVVGQDLPRRMLSRRVLGVLAHRSQNGPFSPRAAKWATSSSFDGRTYSTLRRSR